MPAERRLPTSHVPQARLPYQAEPFPDEIIGSWLARLRMVNGLGAWWPTLEAVSSGKRVPVALLDRSEVKGSLGRLLSSLGMTRSQAELRLTTLPFWLALGAHAGGGGEQPDTGIDQGLGPVNGYTLFNVAAGVTPTARFCPSCVRDDFHNQGWPYWHRTHQLPIVLVCHLHGSPLRDRCANCQRVIAPWSKRLVDPLSPTCPFCSADLAEPSRVTDHPWHANYLALARFAYEALHADPPFPANSTVHGAFKRHFRKLRLQDGVTLSGALERAFGLRRINTYTATSKEAKAVLGLCRTPAVRVRSDRTTAPTVAAAFVAVGLDYKAALKVLLGDEEVIPSGRQPAAESVEIWTTETARAAVLDLERTCSTFTLKESLRHRPRLYWYLRLKDLQWLAERIGALRKSRIPSIADDRSYLVRVMSLDSSGDAPLASLRNRPEYIRARIRDSDWFEGAVHDLENVRRDKSEMDRARLLSGRANRLSAAIAEHCNSRDRPQAINVMSLSRLTGLGMVQIMDVIDFHPGIQADIDRAGESFVRRRIEWATRQVLNSGGAVTRSAIFRVAGFKKTYGQASEVIEEVLKLQGIA